MAKSILRIRDAVPNDLPKLAELSRQWADAHITKNYMPDNTDELCNRLGECSLVAEIDGQVVGFALGEIKPTKGNELVEGVLDDRSSYLEVQDLYVSVGHRRRGIGTELMQELISRGAEKGVANSLVYSANHDYISTARFYERLGYEMWHIHMTRKREG